jgi:hypothetical protein
VGNWRKFKWDDLHEKSFCSKQKKVQLVETKYVELKY